MLRVVCCLPDSADAQPLDGCDWCNGLSGCWMNRSTRKMLAGMIEAHRASGGGVISALHGDAPFEASAEVVL